MNKDRYYIDYRIGEIRKNLDTTFLAPEMYNEVIVDDSKNGMYSYTYGDDQNRKLVFSFTQEQLDDSQVSFREMLDAHCKENYFDPHCVVDKRMYISQEMFDNTYTER